MNSVLNFQFCVVFTVSLVFTVLVVSAKYLYPYIMQRNYTGHNIYRMPLLITVFFLAGFWPFLLKAHIFQLIGMTTSYRTSRFLLLTGLDCKIPYLVSTELLPYHVMHVGDTLFSVQFSNNYGMTL